MALGSRPNGLVLENRAVFWPRLFLAVRTYTGGWLLWRLRTFTDRDSLWGGVKVRLVTEVPAQAIVVALEHVLGDEDLVHLVRAVSDAQCPRPLIHAGER